MKYITITFLIALAIPSIAQTQTDSITVHTDVILKASERIRQLERDLGLKDEEVVNLNQQISALTKMDNYNKAIIDYRDSEIAIYKSALDRFVDFPVKPDTKWYNTRQFSFASGVLIGGLTIFSGAYIVSLIR